MPFNKGDFTQQGVAGHVNANLRLNEKRLVNIDLTSDEEAEGCTIAGTVTDLLNDKVYPIGSAPTGNIEITENGENINVAPYATATVNVAGGGGGNVKTLELTANATGEDQNGSVTVPNINQDGFFERGMLVDTTTPITIQALIGYESEDEEYFVELKRLGTVHFTENNTGVNCEIYFDSDYPANLYIVITDITQPASAVINVTTGVLG